MTDTTAPVVLWDVDNVLNPHVPTAGHRPHHYEGPGPLGTPVSGEVYVGVYGGVRFGRSAKAGPIREFLGTTRPAFWIDDVIGGKDDLWAEDRTAEGIPTVARRIESPAGLTRADIDAALAWLDDVRAAEPRRGATR